ncbi:MAG: 30S ribosomal protein S2 [Actinobacteria bacterium]|nr:30S ribosomal protein S2 [Actinomycetota bacterium]
MATPGIKELLQAGVHYGHQTRRWNPKMKRYIHGEAGGIYVIDLLQTERLLEDAREFVGGIARKGGTVLFVGTKKQARDSIKETAEKAKMPYVNHRWLGGVLTNFQTINMRIRRLHQLEGLKAEGKLNLLPTKERMKAESELVKLNANLGGVKDMARLPDAVVIIDVNAEEIAVKEARRLRIPIVALVDTNCDPEPVDFVVPGNDDAIRSCRIILNALGEMISERHSEWKQEFEAKQAEEAERRRKEDEERAKKEAEEKARREAAKAAGEPEPEPVPEATWKGEAPKEDPEMPQRGGRGGRGGRGPRGGQPPAADKPADAPAAEKSAAPAGDKPAETPAPEAPAADAAPEPTAPAAEEPAATTPDTDTSTEES